MLPLYRGAVNERGMTLEEVLAKFKAQAIESKSSENISAFNKAEEFIREHLKTKKIKK